jgi:fermentation-respiration switch protein FrsA (DUF1100 family)
MVLHGVSSVYPSIKPSEIASDKALALFPEIDKVCLGPLNDPSRYGGLSGSELVREGADLGPLTQILKAQNPDLKIKAPVLLAQGLGDTTVFPFMTNQLDGELRARKNKVQYLTYPDVSHVGIVGAADLPTRKFFAKRLK